MNTVTNMDLVTCLDLSNAGPEEKPVYQFVYGSELYQTLFGIFARFKVTESPKGYYNLNELSLVLLNYQGIINLGFKGALTHKIESNADGEDCHFIDFGVQGCSTKLDHWMRFVETDPVVVKKGDRFRITFRRELHPLPGFEFDVNARTNPTQALGSEVPALTLFDTEFQARNGTAYYDQPLRPGMHGAPKPPAGYKFPSPRCYQSDVNLYY